MHKQIYLCGAISNLTKEQYSVWRRDVQNRFEGINSDWRCFNPARHFCLEDVAAGKITDKQAMDIDLYQLRRSDLVFANFDFKPDSIGSAMEIGIAYDSNIPIIGVNPSGYELHPWIKDMCTRIFDDIDSAIQFAVEQYLDVY